MNRNSKTVPTEQAVSLQGFMSSSLENFREQITLPLALRQWGEFFAEVAFLSLPNTLSLLYNESP